MSAAAARERNERLYEDGGGYGKFRKRPFRRTTQTTPYDRPQTAIRNSSGSSNGWLSRLVDPAQRLIASSAYKLFSSVFPKRLPAPSAVTSPPQLPEKEREREANWGAMDEQAGTVSTDRLETHGAAADGRDGPSNSSDCGVVSELELILKQKTFTRSEIDRLTALLQSRTVDFPIGNEEKKSEAVHSRAILSQEKRDSLNTPVKENGSDCRFNSTPFVGSSVHDEDLASPADLAKAYMGSRPSKVSPSMLESRSQPLRENSMALTSHAFAPKSPMLSIVERSSGHAGFPENGSVTPRFRGRSAIYSMARTPYSRVNTTSGLQGTATGRGPFSGPSSSSQNARESNRFSGSKPRALKWRNSVLDNDIGSVGPIRRIRQKSNLLPTSGTLSIGRTGISSNASQHPSMTEKRVVEGEPSKADRGNYVHSAGFAPIPSKSSEMASKILQQLDVLVTSREKSPAKLSPSMLRGPALRSLENVDSSKLLAIDNDSNKLDVKHGTLVPDARESVSLQQDRIKDNGPSKPIVTSDNAASEVNCVDASSLLKNDGALAAFQATSTIAQPPLHKKRAFQMSAHEDFLELDDNDYSNGAAAGVFAEGREKVDFKLVQKKAPADDSVIAEKPPARSEVFFPSSSTLNQRNAAVDGSTFAEKSTDSTFLAPSPTMTDNHKSASLSAEASRPKDSDASDRIFGSKEKVVLPKELNGTSQSSLFSSIIGDKVPQLSFSSSSVMDDLSGTKVGQEPNAKPDGSSFLQVNTSATELRTNEPGSDKTNDKTSVKAGDFFRASENVPSAPTSSSTSQFLFGITSNGSSLDNRTPALSVFSSPSPVVSSNITSQNSPSVYFNGVANSTTNVPATTSATTNTNGSSSSSILASAPSLSATPAFSFGSVPSTSAPTPPSTTAETAETKTKGTGASFGGISSAITSTAGSIFGGGTSSAITNIGNDIFGYKTAFTSRENSVFDGTSSTVTSSGSSVFAGTSALTSTGSGVLNATSPSVSSTGFGPFNFSAGSTFPAATTQSQGSNPFSAGSIQASSAGTGLTTSTQSTPIPFSSPASTPAFGLTGITAFSSGSSTLSSSTTNLFSSGTTFGVSSSESSSVSTTTSSTSTVFGSGWQGPKSSVFGSNFNSSSSSSGVFAFGASSAPNAVTSNAPMFGSTPSVSTGSLFPFSSPAPATTTASQSVFGNPNPTFPFASSPSGNNDQMSMEDSMAEDTVQATTPSAHVFSQQPASPGFIFGGPTASAGGNQFGSMGSSGANPFQFGSQPNLSAPQNLSPFQASSSLEFNAGGSFSLGTGGGDKSGRRILRVKKGPRKR